MTTKITLVRGDTKNINVTVYQYVNAAKVRADLTGATVKTTWRKAVETAIPALEKVGEVVDGANGMIRVAFVPLDTRPVAPGSYVFDIEVTIDDNVYTVLDGVVELKADVTRPAVV